MLNGRIRTAFFAVLLTFGISSVGLSIANKVNFDSEYYSHIPALYLTFCAILVYERSKIFPESRFSPYPGALIIGSSAVIFAFIKSGIIALSPNDLCSALAFSLLIYTAGAFLFCFGPAAFRKAAFPLSLLILSIPIPDFLLAPISVVMRAESAAAASIILGFFNIFPVRDGFFLRLPEITVEVAEQCSGMRSSIAILIISVLYGRYCLKTYIARAALIALAVPALPVKNGVRIAALMALSAYWKKEVLSGPLHTSGGLVFFGIALLWLIVVLYALIKIEKAALGRTH